MKKLNKLYDGEIFVKDQNNCFLNLTNQQLSTSQTEFLNLGLNFHLKSKYKKLDKVTEIEILYNDILELDKENKITIDNNLQDQLRNESTKHRNPFKKNILTPELKQAAKELKNHANITVRKADKSQTYVILDKKNMNKRSHK